MIRDLLVLPSGEEIFSGTVGENAICTVAVTRCVNSEEDLTPGAVCADMLEVSIIAQNPLSLTAGEEITLYSVTDGGTRTKEGIFIAQKPVWESANRYTVTAYDRVSRLDKDLTHWLANLRGWPYKLLDFASMVCSECGLELITQEIPNGDYPVQAFSAEGITGRQLMQWVGQAAGRFCRATPDGQIEFSWYKKSDTIIGPSARIIQEGPANTIVFEQVRGTMPLRVNTEIPRSMSGKKSITLYNRGRNLLDLQTAGIYHSNSFNSVRHSMKITDTGIRLDIIERLNTADKTLWGFCLGTAKELIGKTITISADYTTSLTGNHAIAYFGFFGVDEEPVTDPRENLTNVEGGYLYPGSFQQLAVSSGTDAKSVTYKVTGQETRKYIALLMAFCNPGRVNPAVGSWTQWDNIQVEYGDIPTEYRPYHCDVYTRTFDTVYGGNLDWNTGVLTVTHGKIQSYAGETVPDGWVSTTGKLNEGEPIIYPLEKPYTIQLTPQTITIQEGYNCLWTNIGTSVMGFYQDYYFLGGFRYEDYQVAPVEKVQVRLTETDVGAIYPDDGQAGNTFILSGNYLLTNADADALEEIARKLYEELKDMTYTPCKLEIPATVQVSVGDVITVKDQDDREISVYVMNHTRSGQKATLECTGSPRRDSIRAVNKQSYKALSGKVLQLQTDIEGLKVANRDARGQVSNLELTVEGIATAVCHQQQNEENLQQQMTQIRQTADQVSLSVQNLREIGVSKVKTDMGYTFDDEGLKISRSDGEMTNLLDNTGMYVNRGSDTVLQANNEGVQAINIAVEKYLSVGKNARFEDYNNGSSQKRTACFFTGG